LTCCLIEPFLRSKVKIPNLAHLNSCKAHIYEIASDEFENSYKMSKTKRNCYCFKWPSISSSPYRSLLHSYTATQIDLLLVILKKDWITKTLNLNLNSSHWSEVFFTKEYHIEAIMNLNENWPHLNNCMED